MRHNLFYKRDLAKMVVQFKIYHKAKQYTRKNAGLKNNPILTTLLGHYGTEHTLGWFDPAAGLDAFNPECLGW